MERVFSVIVPVYKVEDYIKKCVDSILNQSFQDFELILVDDGSPDQCPQICDEYAKKDDRVKVIHKENGGLISARNAGLMTAQGEYICYVDSDDWIDLELLEKVYIRAISPYDADIIIYNMMKQFKAKKEKCPYFLSEGFYNKNRLQKEVYPYMIWDCRKPFYRGMIFPSAGGKIIKRNILTKHYCKNEKIKIGEDNAYLFECLYYANSMYALPEDLYIYNQLNQKSMLHCYDANRLYNNRLLVDYMTENLCGKDLWIDRQFNVFKAYWLIMAVFHEVKCKRPLLGSVKHIRKTIKENQTLKDINISGLPKAAKFYILFLKMHMYLPVLIGTKLINVLRELVNGEKW